MTETTRDAIAEDADEARAEKRGCASIGIVLLLFLGCALLVPPVAVLLQRPVPDAPGMGIGRLGAVLYAFCSICPAVALLVAASPRGVAPRWL